jgi:peptide/nickel transport system substrate-binding protein
VRKQLRNALLGAVVITAVAIVGVNGGFASSHKTDTVKAGGTYRLGWDSEFGWTDSFDPTGEYLGDAYGIYAVMIRTLVGSNHVAGPAGTKPVPDIATALPKPTNGGKTYTFHLKPGIMFGPPVNRAVTSKDVLYAMERLANPKDGAQYSFYYDDSTSGAIKGWHAYATGKAKTISGIKTPNASTIVFNLTQAEGDFLGRMSMPATAPIPEEVAKCFEGKPGKYGRDLVSTGPYMIEGADKVNASSCAALKPMSGFDGVTNLTLVRNPAYNPKTDSKKAREALPDKFVFTVNANTDDIFNRIKAGELEDNETSASPKAIREFSTNPSLRSRLHYNVGDSTYYIFLNLTQPPFDDLHVRKAMSLIIDKAGLRKAWGGPTGGLIAGHIVPDTLENNILKNFDPYRTPGSHGDLKKAMAEMKLSRYDTKHDGKCNAQQCKGVLLIQGERSQDAVMTPIIVADAAKIGITFTVRAAKPAYPVIQTISKNIPISERPRSVKDYADALTVLVQVTSSAIAPSGNANYSLVGITPAMAKKFGAKGNVKNVPSVDGKFKRCASLLGNQRVACWAALDKYIMLKVVPWIPVMFGYNVHTLGPRVAKWEYDQFGDTTSFAHVAVKP